jgi:hypothetical protein
MKSALYLLLVPALLTGCLAPMDDPTRVHDLRVLGVNLSPPELMAPSCGLSPEALRVFSSPVRLTALVTDPKGAGRAVRFQLFACAAVGDRDCMKDRVTLQEGELTVDPAVGYTEVPLTVRPALAVLPDNTPLIQRVFDEDVYKGLGGLRIPLVLHLTAGAEEIWAQKLMVYSCAFFPESRQNVNPELPGVLLNEAEWSATDVPTVGKAQAPFKLRMLDFSDREEDYVVPSFELSPVFLHESWKVNWYSTLGSFSPGQTGGTNFVGEESKSFTEWRPPYDATEQDVQFWMVTRDGRGGMSWMTRRLHYKPD